MTDKTGHDGPDQLSEAFTTLRTESQGLDTMEPLRTATSRPRTSQWWTRMAFAAVALIAAVGVAGWMNRSVDSGTEVSAGDDTSSSEDEVSDGDSETTDEGPANFPDPDALVGTSWTLRFGGGPEGEVPIVDGWPITLTFDEGSLGGTAACNGYGSSFTLDGDQIFLEGIGQNTMGCAADVQESEQKYLAALGDVGDLTVVGDELALSGMSTELIFRRNAEVPAGDLFGTLWLLDTLIEGETASTVLGDPATLIINEDGTFSGSTGCRTFSGRYQIYGNSVQFNEFGAGDGNCPNSLQRQDGQVFGVLGDGFTVEIDGDRLTVTSSGGEGLSYRAITEDELAEIPSEPTASDADLLNEIEWVFVGGYDDPENSDTITIIDPRSIDQETTITLTFADGEFSGNLVCNTYGGGVEIGSGQMTFNPQILSTRVGCPPEFNDVIVRYGNALPLMTEFGIEADGQRLVMNGSDIELHFERLES